jgi:hypothetical protein
VETVLRRVNHQKDLDRRLQAHAAKKATGADKTEPKARPTQA